MSPVLAIGNYDFQASGTVAKSIEIAIAAADAGFPVELWAMRARGPLLARVPAHIPVVAVAGGRALTGRAADMVLNVPRLALMLRRRQPGVVLSGGNHFHRVCRAALNYSGRRAETRLILRASNSSQRAGRSMEKAGHHVRRKFGGADAVVAVCQELADELRMSGVTAPLSAIANGVDLTRIQRMAAAPFDHSFLHHGVPVIATMGRMVRQKGFDTVIRAFAGLQRRQDARLLLIGDGTAEQRLALRAMAVEEGVADRIDLLGYQDNPFAILSRADLFVSGSRWEGASNTLVEALACGLPLVATDCPTGNREVVNHGPYGTIVRVDDVEGLAAAMRLELDLKRDRHDQGTGALNWTIERCLNAWIRLLEREFHALSGTKG